MRSPGAYLLMESNLYLIFVISNIKMIPLLDILDIEGNF